MALEEECLGVLVSGVNGVGQWVKGVRGEGIARVKDLCHLEIILDPLMEVPSIAKNSTIFYGTININCNFHNT